MQKITKKAMKYYIKYIILYKYVCKMKYTYIIVNSDLKILNYHYERKQSEDIFGCLEFRYNKVF
jgi:hypothetical protein